MIGTKMMIMATLMIRMREMLLLQTMLVESGMEMMLTLSESDPVLRWTRLPSDLIRSLSL